MAARDEGFGADLTLVEGGDGVWSPSEAAPAFAPRDWRSEYEREHARAERERARADAAEARCEELRWAEVDSRARAGSLKWQLDRSRSKLKAAVEETQEVRHAAKDTLSLQAEVARLEKLLSAAGVKSGKGGRFSSVGKVRRRLTDQTECRYYGRDFTAEEMALLRALIAVDPQPTRAGLSRKFCRRIGWFKPDGRLKDMMARVTMLAMHKDGLIILPPPRGRQHRPKPIVFGPDTEPPLLPAPTTLDDVRPINVHPVVRETREGRLWNEFVARYHYLGYKTLVGAQMRYAVHDRNGWPIAMLGFSTAAWKLAPRDNYIGWTPPLRRRTFPSSSTTRGSSSCPGSRSPTSGRTSSPSSADACPWTGPSATTQRPCSSRPSSRGRDTPAPSTGPPVGSASEPPRGEAAMIGTSSTTSPVMTSGYAPFEKTGNEPSIAKISLSRSQYACMHAIKQMTFSTAPRNAYCARESPGEEDEMI